MKAALALRASATKADVIGEWFHVGTGRVCHFAIDRMTTPRRVLFACGRAPRFAQATRATPVGGGHCETCIRAVDAAMRPAIGCAA